MARHRAVLRDYFDQGAVMRVARVQDYVGDVYKAGRGRRLAEWLVRANNRVYDLIGGIPAQWERDWRLLRDPVERRLLLRAISNEALLTSSRRQSLVSILVWLGVLGWAVAGIVVSFAARDVLPNFQAMLTLFFYGLATSLFLPLPFETLLGSARAHLGVPWTVVIAATSKTAGAAIVLILGDRAHVGLEATIHRYPRIQRAWDATLRLAHRYGYAAVFVIFAIPFMSDTLPLFLLAVMNMRKGIFLGVTFAAIALRSILFLYAGDVVRQVAGALG